MEKVRCPACRGSKQVPKLGGMLGDCNQCQGQGCINAADKVVPVKVQEQSQVPNIVEQVAECTPVSNLKHVLEQSEVRENLGEELNAVVEHKFQDKVPSPEPKKHVFRKKKA